MENKTNDNEMNNVYKNSAPSISTKKTLGSVPSGCPKDFTIPDMIDKTH